MYILLYSHSFFLPFWQGWNSHRGDSHLGMWPVFVTISQVSVHDYFT